jgi:hypothetical protein
MAKKATKLEDIGDERDQAFFLAAAQVLFNGDLQKAFDNYNEAELKYEQAVKDGLVTGSSTSKSEVRLKASR